MSEFFVPHAKDAEEGESVWNSVREFLDSQGYPTSEKKIYSLEYEHNGKGCFDRIGELDRYSMEEILIILEGRGVYYCCTKGRGVVRGTPILCSGGARVTTFE